MKSKLRPILAVGVILCCSDYAARATTLFYGGDPEYFAPPFSYGGPAGANAFENDQAYEHFAVPAGQTWSVTGLFANIGDYDLSANPTPLANWYIRTGVTTASLGTLVASGTSTSASTTDTLNGFGLNGGGATGVLQTITLSTPVLLAGGQTYWVAVQPTDNSPTHLFMGGTKAHVNAVGDPLNSVTYSQPGGISPDNFDWSEGLIGTSVAPVPELSTWAMMLLGFAGLGYMGLRDRRLIAS